MAELEIIENRAFNGLSLNGRDKVMKYAFNNNLAVKTTVGVSPDRDNDSIDVTCPHCDTHEGWGVDEPRKRFYILPIIHWYPDREDANELSINKCTDCHKEFLVEWDYDNEIT